jgi:DNA-directed RNA polymerase specialized sigma24 family protein
MIAGSSCDCLICRLERSLTAKLREQWACAEYQLLVASKIDLSRFTSPILLVEELHRRTDNDRNPRADLILIQILRECNSPKPNSIWTELLLLVFIPTIHKTTTQVVVTFSSLSRDDVSQHVLASFLEQLASRDLQGRHSHIAYTIARGLRRKAFRWAIQESRALNGNSLDDEHPASETLSEEALAPHFLLNEFLDACERAGLLSPDERRLLEAFKIDGVAYAELARRNGHTAVATKRRVQRLIGRLREIAATKALPRQLELFAKSGTANGTGGF